MRRFNKNINKRQVWFWTERWQKGEEKAEEDIREGRVHNFADAQSAVRFLHTKAGIKKFKGKKEL